MHYCKSLFTYIDIFIHSKWFIYTYIYIYIYRERERERERERDTDYLRLMDNITQYNYIHYCDVVVSKI